MQVDIAELVPSPRPTIRRFSYRINYGLFAVAVVLAFVQLMTTPVVGVADNGDWGKLLGHYGLGSGVAYKYANTRFTFGNEYRYHSGFTSSEHLLIQPALTINQWISRDGSFDLRVIGGVHAFFYLLALYVFLRCVGHTVVGGLGVVLFCDFLYTGYLNSFYMDVAALVFTALSVAFYVRCVRDRRTVDIIALVVFMLAAALSKPQYAILGVWFAALFWVARGTLARGRKIVAGGVSLLLVSASVMCFVWFSPKSYATKGAFTVVFSQILPNTPNQNQALNDLGLDSSYRRFIGENAYSIGTIMDDPNFYQPLAQKISYPRIARYYLTHPNDGWKALSMSLGASGYFHSPGGNFDASSGKPPVTAYDGFQWASKMKRAIFHRHGIRFLFAFVFLGALLIYLLISQRNNLPQGSVSGGLVFAGMVGTMLAVSTLADVYEQVRHQLTLLAMFDMLLVACVWLLLRAFQRRTSTSNGT